MTEIPRDNATAGSRDHDPDGADAAIANIDLFRGLSPDELRQVRGVAQHREAVDGEVIVAQWDTSSELYVILEGSAEVLVRGEKVGEIGPGDFFGEIAAVDWGAGQWQSRAATVRATSYMYLLVIPANELRPLMEQLPLLATRIRDVVRQLRSG